MSDRYGLIGKQISYSKSKVIHQHMAKKLNLDIVYDMIDCEEEDLPKIIKKLRHGEYQGFNVTIPYKQKIIRFIDELTPKARRIGAVNTLYVRNDHVIGDNTDYDGFLGLLTKHEIDVKDQNVYLLGTGGAAKASYIVLKDLGAKVTVVTRSIDENKGFFDRVITYPMISPKDVSIYVNTTPLGTSPKIDEAVLEKRLVTDQTIVDLIYNPQKTKLMTYSKQSYNGLYMLIIQALKSEEIWFNRKIDISLSLLNELKEVIYS